MYGGVVKACAFTAVYPKFATIVGKVYDREYVGTEPPHQNSIILCDN